MKGEPRRQAEGNQPGDDKDPPLSSFPRRPGHAVPPEPLARDTVCMPPAARRYPSANGAPARENGLEQTASAL